MVGCGQWCHGEHHRFQYSLCRVVLMVAYLSPAAHGHMCLSVLALSSRFDGPLINIPYSTIPPHFQYSLCRVVLMVAARFEGPWAGFVLSVLALSSRFDGQTPPLNTVAKNQLSVLALSSRFDGQTPPLNTVAKNQLSVLALSSRFDGLYPAINELELSAFFQYSLCRVVLMVRIFPWLVEFQPSSFSTRSVESF